VAIFEALGDANATAICLFKYGKIAYLRKEPDYALALEHFQACLEQFELLDNPDGVCGTRLEIGKVASVKADYQVAQDQIELAVIEFQNLGHAYGLAISPYELGKVALANPN